MTMKIDGNRLTTDTEATEAARKAALDRQVQRTGVDRPGAASRDRVEVSPDAQLLASAITAAQTTPAIRTELVERIREKLNAGEIGRDAGALADRLIDDLLNR